MTLKKLKLFAVLVMLFAVILFLSGSSQSAEKPKKGGAPMVSEGKTVKVNYTLKVEGKVVDSSTGRDPLEFKAGSRQMIPGFEKAVMGMRVGEKKSFKVSPEDGYGKEDPNAIQNVPKDQLPSDIKPQAGMVLYAQTKDGQQVPVKVMEVKNDVVVMNFNHPLAGKTLNFDVEVMEVR